MTHLDNLITKIPDILQRYMLDLGCGWGEFMKDVESRGGRIVGVDSHPGKAGICSKAEKLPFEDDVFDFINICEVIEHVDNPYLVMKEAYRVLKKDGIIYISVPNRFGLIDQHYHVPFISWLPRKLGDLLLSLSGKQKDNTQSGKQKLSEMHYMTFGKTKKLFSSLGFSVEDTRRTSVVSRHPYLLPVYILCRTVYLDSFHIILKKI